LNHLRCLAYIWLLYWCNLLVCFLLLIDEVIDLRMLLMFHHSTFSAENTSDWVGFLPCKVIVVLYNFLIKLFVFTLQIHYCLNYVSLFGCLGFLLLLNLTLVVVINIYVKIILIHFNPILRVTILFSWFIGIIMFGMISQNTHTLLIAEVKSVFKLCHLIYLVLMVFRHYHGTTLLWVAIYIGLYYMGLWHRVFSLYMQLRWFDSGKIALFRGDNTLHYCF
jgi:hypothetical protein